MAGGDYIKAAYSSWMEKSCETISDELYETLPLIPGRDVWIEVSEDGECGSYSQYSASEQRK